MMQSKWYFKAFVSTGLLVISIPWSLAAQTASMTSADARSRAEQLLKQMTIEEKVGQMNQSSGIVMPLLANEKPDNLIAQGQVGSILWLIDVKEINRLQHLAVEKSRLHIPILFGIRRDPWLPDRLSRSARHGVLVGSGASKKPRNISQARMLAPPASSGPSPPWSTLHATPAGAASSKAPAKILI